MEKNFVLMLSGVNNHTCICQFVNDGKDDANSTINSECLMEGNTYDCLLRETLWLGKRYFMYMTMVVMGKACGGAARKGCDPFDFVPSDVDSDPFSVSNYSPSSDSESDENKKVLESTPNSLRASNTMEKQGILTLRENSEHFEAEPTPVSLRSSCNTMEKQDSLTLRVHPKFIEI
nr:uncharacterized protein LOC117687935 isoform X2 [Crassostrea gigas]